MSIWLWIGFLVFVGIMVALDLGVFHRTAHEVSTLEALMWTGIWIGMALLFNVAVYFIYEHHWLGMGQDPAYAATGRQAALQFFTGYVIEKSLSLDNIFIIALIFGYFGVPRRYQHRVLFWGVLGAVVMRAGMIAAGAALIARFDWTVYAFGALLLITAVRMLVAKQETVEPERNPLVRLVKRWLPMRPTIDDARLFVRNEGRLAITPLFVVLVLVESSDVMFAVDSVPAIFAITRDPFLVFTSNIFAILGLRSLYFALAAIMAKFRHLKTSLVFLLAFVGTKMMLVHHYPIPTSASLAIIVAILAVGVLASVVEDRREHVYRFGRSLGAALLRNNSGTYRQARRVVVAVIGVTILLIGLAMLVLPGPGLLVIVAGLGVLATEFVWAKRLLRRAHQRTKSWTSRLDYARRQVIKAAPQIDASAGSAREHAPGAPRSEPAGEGEGEKQDSVAGKERA